MIIGIPYIHGELWIILLLELGEFNNSEEIADVFTENRSSMSVNDLDSDSDSESNSVSGSVSDSHSAWM